MKKISSGLRPRLTPEIAAQLVAIEPSISDQMKYFPCSVVLKNGQKIDHVYLISQAPYIRYWGIYPEDDPGNRKVPIEDIETVTECPDRLPAKFANQIYKRGESGMGYTIFTVVFADGLREPYLTGNAVDFIEYPFGKTAKDIVKVLPHTGRDKNPRHGPNYYWCLFSDEETERAFQLGLTELPALQTRPFLARVMRWLRRPWRVTKV
jgi:hypothetical protein